MNELQQQASDPNYSIWVSASAGTGKTKILTDRVLRLLINGVPFEKILCLTFTNAAALEMQSRIRSKLEYFALIDANKLVNELKTLLTKDPSKDEILSAKTLYQKLLNSTYGISIYTIHAFCQKLLKLFSFEAGANPGFEIIDDITAQEILQKIRHQIYLSPEHSQLINFFLTNFHEVTINDIFNEIIQQKIKFKKLFTKKLDYLEDDEIISTPLAFQELYDKIRSLFVKYSIDIIDDQEIQQFFLTKDFSKRKNILPKSLAAKHPELLQELEYFQEEIFKLDQQIKINEIENYSRLLRQLAKIFLNEYDNYKTKHSLLDYDDLIYHTQVLLSNKNTKDWILYKLDGWISHLLVDEAQDTSPEQWQIITAIIEEFYESTKHDSTVFIVGDEKQSIFSFQGADLESFDTINQNLQKNLSKANKNFRNITLEWSYRSTEEIINIVYIILNQIKNTTPKLFTSENPKILPFRNTHNGKVELWPLIKSEKEDKLFWPMPEDHNNAETSKMLLADKIARFIKQQIASKKILPATNLPVKESDFMILVRKRDELVLEIIATLKKHGLQVEDIDRVTLDQNLSVMDLMSIAKFVLLPQDNLNLASLLKSPIIGMSEEELQTLAIARGKNSLWEYLQTIAEYNNIYEQLCYFLQIYKTSNCGNFFSLIIDCFNIRKILVANNGPGSNDLINELIYLSTNYANNVNSLLQNFVYWFENNNIEIKRNLDSSNKIKIMTAHASKGLQAPIVILCDTTSLPTNSNKFVWTEDGEMFSAIKSTNSPEFFKKLKEQQQEKELQEYIRLLYVAMTRAEDHLVICGYQSNNTLPKNCWYELVSKAMSLHGLLDENNIIIYEINNGVKEKHPTPSLTSEITLIENIREPITIVNSGGVCTRNDFATPIYNRQATSDNATYSSPIDYKSFVFDKVLFNKIIKSTKKNYSVKSPLIADDHLQYGKIFHKILEDATKINDFSALSKHPYIQTLPIKLQEKIRNNIDKLLNNEEFTSLSSRKLKTEVTVGINLNNEPKIGRIDLLAIEQGKITIIDYKSDAHPPKTPELVNESYIDQLNFYRHTIQKLYPNSEVTCKILWLENGNFMRIVN